MCNTFGADLVSFSSENEQNWVYNLLNWDTSATSWRYYWIGLNDLQIQENFSFFFYFPNNFAENFIEKVGADLYGSLILLKFVFSKFC